MGREKKGGVAFLLYTYGRLTERSLLTMSYEKFVEAAPYVAGAGIAGVVGIFAYAFCQEEKQKPEGRAKSTPIKGEDNLLPKQKIPKELIVPSDCSGVCFGKSQAYPAGYIGKSATEDGHILVVGSTGSGKTTAIANPSLEAWKGFTVSTFIKGSQEEFVDQRRAEGRKVIVFDPERMENNLVRYDFFAPFGHEPENLVGIAMDIAEILLPLLPEDKDPIWKQAAQTYLTGAIIYGYSIGMSFVKTLRMLLEHPVKGIASLIMDSGSDQAIAFISKIYAADKKLRSGTDFELVPLTRLMSSEMLEAFTPCERCEVLDWQQLNISTEPIDIVLVIPEAKLDLWGPMLGLMLSQLIRSLERRPERTYDAQELPPILIMVDEFPRFGEILPIINGLNTLRSRGVTFLLLVQSLASMDQIYGSNARRIIMENCRYQIILSLADKESQEYFSKLVGTTATIERSSSSSESCDLSIIPPQIGFGYSESQQYSMGRRPLIYPHVFQTQKDIICVTPYGVCQIKKSPQYFKSMKGKRAMDNNQMELTQTLEENTKEEVANKAKSSQGKKKVASGKYNRLNSDTASVIYDIFPEIKEFWVINESDSRISSILGDIKLVLDYSRAHPRFIESLKSGLLH